MDTRKKLLCLSIVWAYLVLNLAASPVPEDELLNDMIARLKQLVRKRDDTASFLPMEHKELLQAHAKADENQMETSEISKRNKRLPCILRDSWGRCRRYKKLGLWGKRNF